MIFLKKINFLLLFLFNFFIISNDLRAQEANTNTNTTEKNTNIDQIELNLSDESLETKKLIGEEGSKALYNIILDNFEDSIRWTLDVSSDNAYGRLSKRFGVPFPISQKYSAETVDNYKDKIKGITERIFDGTYRPYPSSKIQNEKTFVLGGHINFRKRGHVDIKFISENPIYIKGLVKNIEVWVSGRQKPFELYAIMQDINKDKKLISMGQISHLGWKRLYANIPDDFYQNNNNFPSENKGVAFIGFLIRCHPLYTEGDFYVYFDNLSAEISRFWEDYRDLGDPVDTWH